MRLLFDRHRTALLFAGMAVLLLAVGFGQSWQVMLAILNVGLISAVMALGVNIQWGYAGLFNVGIMGFTALGGLGAVLTAMPPVPAAWAAGGVNLGLAALVVTGTVALMLFVRRNLPGLGGAATLAITFAGYVVMRFFLDPASEAIESVNAAAEGYLGGLGLPVLIGWPVGALLAAGVAYVVGRIALGLRSDYLAIATLGISEIILSVLKNENWLTRGVKNVTGLPRPVPYERDLQVEQWLIDLAARFGTDVQTASAIIVRLGYTCLFLAVLAALMWLSQRALHSPWGRMMHAIRDNRDAAEAMGKDVTRRHLQVFVIGSAVVGLGGAMLTTLDGQFTPSSYNPLRYTFLIWVMVIAGGSGNNWGAVLGAMLIWYVWIMAEPAGTWIMQTITAGMEEGSGLRKHLIDSAPHLRPFLMGLILLLVMRFAPRGLIPEHTASRA